MWEHSRRITQVLMEFPVSGLCEMHGIDDHVCLMYTASEDRYLEDAICCGAPDFVPRQIYSSLGYEENGSREMCHK